MPNSFLVDLAPLSEPVTKLITEVSNAIGTVYEPTRIRRKAKAQAESMLILADAKDEVARRAAQRLANQELRRQHNIDAIVQESFGCLPTSVSDKPVNPDWMTRFFADAADVSETELQSIWSRLLAEEVAKPGTVSRKTLSVLRELGREDAEVFGKAAKLAWEHAGSAFIPTEQDRWGSRDPLNDYGLHFSECLELESLGLLQMASVEQRISAGDALVYQARPFVCTESREGGGVPIIPLTRSGFELLGVVDDSPSEAFVDYSAKLFIESGISIACPLIFDTSEDTAEQFARIARGFARVEQ